jgi:hypothetical protein
VKVPWSSYLTLWPKVVSPACLPATAAFFRSAAMSLRRAVADGGRGGGGGGGWANSICDLFQGYERNRSQMESTRKAEVAVIARIQTVAEQAVKSRAAGNSGGHLLPAQVHPQLEDGDKDTLRKLGRARRRRKHRARRSGQDDQDDHGRRRAHSLMPTRPIAQAITAPVARASTVPVAQARMPNMIAVAAAHFLLVHVPRAMRLLAPLPIPSLLPRTALPCVPITPITRKLALAF